jgi:hypothetical protein
MNEGAFRHTSLSPPICGWSVEGSDLIAGAGLRTPEWQVGDRQKSKPKKTVNAGRGQVWRNPLHASFGTLRCDAAWKCTPSK